MAAPVPFADRSLAQRLERAEAEANRRFVEAHARAAPESRACWIADGGAYAMFDGVDSPLTQSFGLGMFEPATAAQLERIEAFFAERGAASCHEVSPLADPSALAVLTERAYVPFEFTSMLYQRLPCVAPPASPAVRVRLAAASEREAWARTSAAGWGEYPELEAFMLGFGRVLAACEDALPFLAEIDGRIVATASMVVHDGVAILAGASTVPDARRRGAQAALLAARLHLAVTRACDVAMMGAQPGSGSQRNAERNGFRVAYTRLKWRCQAPAPSAA
jgi:hypothetical protein